MDSGIVGALFGIGGVVIGVLLTRFLAGRSEKDRRDWEKRMSDAERALRRMENEAEQRRKSLKISVPDVAKEIVWLKDLETAIRKRDTKYSRSQVEIKSDRATTLELAGEVQELRTAVGLLVTMQTQSLSRSLEVPEEELAKRAWDSLKGREENEVENSQT